MEDEIKVKEFSKPEDKVQDLKNKYNELKDSISAKTNEIRARQTKEMVSLYGTVEGIGKISGIAGGIMKELQYSHYQKIPQMAEISPFIHRNFDMWLTYTELDELNQGYVKSLFDLSFDAIMAMIKAEDKLKMVEEKFKEFKEKETDEEREVREKEEEIVRAKTKPISEARKNELIKWYENSAITKEAQNAFARAVNPRTTNLLPNEVEFVRELNQRIGKWRGNLARADLFKPKKKEEIITKEPYEKDTESNNSSNSIKEFIDTNNPDEVK